MLSATSMMPARLPASRPRSVQQNSAVCTHSCHHLHEALIVLFKKIR